MDYPPDARALAVRTGTGWALKPLCDASVLAASANALAVWTADGWALTPMRAPADGENAVAVRVAPASRALLAIGCDAEESGCSGTDGRCSACPCDAELPESFVVSLSGFPSICTVQAFNGAWTVTHEADCTWWCDIDAYRRVSLTISPTLTVYWRVSTPSGPNGTFAGSGGGTCAPETSSWTPDTCAAVYPCHTICPVYFANATCAVATA